MVTLLILDGFGLNSGVKGNAVKIQGTPNLKSLGNFPYTTLKASGEAVGLNEGQMGNSEVGHLNLGAGRVVYQDLPRINNDIKNGEFFNNKNLLKVIKHVKENKSSLHLMGLLSDGGVHSHINHLKALIDLAEKNEIKKVYIHAILDGRDTLRDSAISYVKQIEEYAGDRAKIVSLCGRVYTMDREKRWDRVKKAYDMLVSGKTEFNYESAQEALRKSYENGVYDEFVEPTIIGEAKKLRKNDGFIFFNYRTDRAREITEALTQRPFDNFKVKDIENFCFCSMTEYSADFKGLIVAYPPEKIKNNLSYIISKQGFQQFHVTETTKYAHVTFFFNGGIEEPNMGEDRKLIDSINVQDYSEYPEMRAKEITAEAIKAINSGEYEFVLINLSNPDMIGHTGNLNAAVKAIEICDKCAYEIAMATLRKGGDCIITADHGNAEEMVDASGNVLTSHTLNQVPLWLVSEKHKAVKLTDGALCNVAPTVLKLLEIEIPDFMEKPLF